MAHRSIPISARISQQDADYLAALEIEGAKTPSDKLRALIGAARAADAEDHDYARALRQSRARMQELELELNLAEARDARHSAPLSLLMDWLPETLAYLQGRGPDGRALDDATTLKRFEQGAVARLTRLVEATLRLAVSPSCPCYDPGVITDHAGAVRELAHLIDTVNPGDTVPEHKE